MRFQLIHACAIASTVALSACGGGGDGSSASTTNPATTGTQTPVQAAITVQGSAPKLTVDPLELVYVGPNGSSSGFFGANTVATSSTAAAASQTQLGNGGYSAFNIGSVAVTLTQGTVADVAGTADYQIGRWTNGSGQNVPTMSANQGAYYIAGAPLKLVANQAGGTFACTLAAATKPTAVNGSTAPGQVLSASATIDKAALTANVTVGYSIGADQSVVINKTVPVGGFGSGNGAAVLTTTLGTDATKPILGLVFTSKGPSAGDTSGSAILTCQ